MCAIARWAVFWFVWLVIGVLVFFAWGEIFEKAGYSWWLCLFTLIPIVGLLLPIWFAAARWPVLKELEKVRAGANLPLSE
jgi:hypothetical protein